ncbi:hypothetical protein P8452_51502 [Trifolium repens]|nr:hypothetical protein P8452_51502 [Trifolium repens]
MVFIVRGKLESIGEDGIPVPLSEGDACGEELLRWYLEQSSENKANLSGHHFNPRNGYEYQFTQEIVKYKKIQEHVKLKLYI